MKTLANDIKNKSFKNAYLLCGEEEYLKLNYKNRLIKSIAGDDTMNLGMYEGKNIDINEVIDSAETVPFFAEYRLIVMENTGLFKSGGEQLAEYMKTIPSTTIFLFVESDVDKRSKMYAEGAQCLHDRGRAGPPHLYLSEGVAECHGLFVPGHL